MIMECNSDNKNKAYIINLAFINEDTEGEK
uniref:Uncharacterized protein n=1 Tax=Arundo donax TaxID=35708 RepID=A0A0A9HY15_ARUDO